MFVIQEETDLLSAAFDGPFEQPMWQTFLERLRVRTRADSASITFRPPDRPRSSTIHLVAGRAIPRELAQLYEREVWERDPLPYFDLREERVYSLSELLLPGDPVHDAFRRDMMIPNKVNAMRLMRITEPGGVSAWISINRETNDFTPADGALLSRIGPHFRRALRCYAEIERQKASARIADNVMARLNFGWIRLDANGVVMEESQEAAKLMQYGVGLRRTRSGRLIADDPLIDRKLSRAMRAIVKEANPRPHAINVSMDPWVNLLIVPAAPDPQSPTASGAAVAYIQGDNRSRSDRHEQIAELFGLLPSEARLALALSNGQSIAEAAQSLGITVETARNYSKKIYAKMGARGQSDLIRFILTSVLALS